MIHVCPLSRLPETLAASGAVRMISLLSADSAVERPAHLPAADHLHLAFHDILREQEGYIAPSGKHIEAILAFAKRWDRQRPLLVHCFAGISRSTAAAYIIAAAHDSEQDEAALAQRLRALSPTATPNLRMIALADDILGRRGRMTAAIRAIGRGADAFEGVPFVL